MTLKKTVAKSATKKMTTKKLVQLPDDHFVPTSQLSSLREVSGGFSTYDHAIQFSIGLGLQYNRNIFDEILAIKGCVGIRFYHRVNANNELTLLIAGINKYGKELYLKRKSKKNSLKNTVDGEVGLADMGGQCPAYIPPTEQ